MNCRCSNQYAAKGASLVGVVMFMAGLHFAFGMLAIYVYDEHMWMSIAWTLAAIYIYLGLVIINYMRRGVPF